MRKIINLTVFAIAGLAALLLVIFGFITFNQSTKDKFFNTNEVKASNPQMIADLENATLETLPTFIETYQKQLTVRNAELKEFKIQRDIFYTFIYHLNDINNQESFETFNANFNNYSKSMFAKANNKDYFIDGFNKLASYSKFNSYLDKLKSDYEVVKQDYLSKVYAVKAETNYLKQVSDINAAVSEVKKQYDLTELQKNTKTYQSQHKEFNFALVLTYILFFSTLAAMVIFLFLGLFVNIKSGLGLLLGIGVLVVLIIIGYFTASIEPTPVTIKMGADIGTLKIVGAELFTFYCMFFATLALIVYTIIFNMIKTRK